MSMKLTREVISGHLSDVGISPETLKHVYTKVNLKGLRLKSIELLQEYKQLQVVHVENNDLHTLKPLAVMKQLREVNAAGNAIKEFLDFEGPTGLHKVNYDENGVTKLGDVARHPYLKHIQLAGNELKGLEELEALKYLEYLDVSKNNIVNVSNIDHLPLKELYLNGNMIQTISNLSPIKTLHTLDLSNNEIEYITGISKHSYLYSLNLSNNFIESVGQIVELAELPRLALLNLSGNTITSIPKYRLHIAHLLPNLVKLDNKDITLAEKVASQEFYDDFALIRKAIHDRFLPGEKPVLPELEEMSTEEKKKQEKIFWLKMVDYGFFQDWEAILTELYDLKRTTQSLETALYPEVDKMKFLNLSDIPLGDMGLYALAQMMDEMNSLSELNLDNVMHDRWMSRKSKSFGLQVLVDRIVKSNVTNLSMNNNSFGRSLCYVLNHVLFTTSLTTLNLSGNSLGEHVFQKVEGQNIIVEECPSFKIFCKGILKSSIKSLDLSSNKLDEYSGVCLGSLLEDKSCSIETLIIGDNPFGIRGGFAIAKSLKSNKSLKTVNMSGSDTCRLEEGTFMELGSHIARHPNLTNLDISNNDVGDTGGSIIASSLASSKILLLNMSNTRIGARTFATLASAKLESLNLSRNPVSSSAFDIFLAGFAVQENFRCVLDISYIERSNNTANLLGRLISSGLRGLISRGSKEPNLCFTSDDAIIISDAIANNKTLGSIDLSCNYFDGNATSSLLQSFGVQGNFESITLGYNEFNTSSINALYHSMSLLKNLHTLDLSGVIYTEEQNITTAFKSLCSEIQVSKVSKINFGYSNLAVFGSQLGDCISPLFASHISELNFSNCSLNEKLGLDKVFSTFSGTVKRLILSNNSLGDSLVSLLKTIALDTTLYSLELDGNKVSENCFRALADCLNSNCGLRRLKLFSSQIKSDFSIGTVLESFANNKSLVEVDFADGFGLEDPQLKLVHTLGADPETSTCVISYQKIHDDINEDESASRDKDLICNAYASLLTRGRIRSQYNKIT